MRIISILFLLSILSSCFTKKQAIKKFCSQDSATTTIVIHDTLIVDRITSDTIFSTDIDTITLVKDKLVIQYRKQFGKVHLSGTYQGDTIYKEIYKQVKVPCNCPQVEVTWIDKCEKWLSIWGLLCLFALVIYILLKVKQ